MDDFHLWMTANFRTCELIGKMELPFQDGHGGPVGEPILSHFRSDRGRTHNHDTRLFWEIRDLVTVGDHRWIELVNTNDRHKELDHQPQESSHRLG